MDLMTFIVTKLGTTTDMTVLSHVNDDDDDEQSALRERDQAVQIRSSLIP